MSLPLSYLASPAALASKLSGGTWKRKPHLDLISRTLVELCFSNDGRAVWNIPPRHGKSELTSHYAPVWALEHFPKWRIVIASYGW